MGASFIPADWQVRVSGSSGIVDIPSDRLCVRTIPLPMCMERRSHYRGRNFLQSQTGESLYCNQ